MALDSILRPGDKIDVRSVSAINRAERTGEKVSVMASQVLDFVGDNVVIAMPYDMGRMILLDVGITYEMVFYTSKGLYRAMGQVASRHKDNNIYTATVALTTDLVKYQRREYFRLQCIIGIQTYVITEEIAKRRMERELAAIIEQEEIAATMQSGVAVDLSGGGIRYISMQMMEPGTYIAVKLGLNGENVNEVFVLAGRIISSVRAINATDRYETRIEFCIHTPKIQDSIIKYIFDEDRKLRQRGR